MAPFPAARTPATVMLGVVTVGLYLALALVIARPRAFVLRTAEAGIGAPAIPLEDRIVPEVIPIQPMDGPGDFADEVIPLVDDAVECEALGTDCAFASSSSIGVGGGAGGMFGARRGGRARALLRAASLDEGGEFPSSASFEASAEPGFVRPFGEGALSTFSVDVDTASYALVRRFLQDGGLPPEGAVRVEEMVNAFRYDDAPPRDGDALAARIDAAACPWAPRHRLVRVALKGRVVAEEARPAANLVFLIDVSGSMDEPDKLPLVKASVRMLLERLTVRDRVAIVVYAGCEGLALPSTPAGDHAPILAALDHLGANGSTNGGAGIQLAYRIAEENLVRGGINRVILATDGDFNVGVTDREALVDLVAKKAEGGVNLTVLGYGLDNLRDATMVRLADRGNGNYGHIDGLEEARKVLVEEGLSNLMVVAKDAKIQVEWNPRRVAGWRLLGYEKRHLKTEDFRDDGKDAGEVGPGHSVTAFFEVVPAGEPVPGLEDGAAFESPADAPESDALLTARVRWKVPEGGAITEIERPFVEAGVSFREAPADFRFGAAVALFGMLLRDSANAGTGDLDMVREIAAGALGADPDGRRAQFVHLVEAAKLLRR